MDALMEVVFPFFSAHFTKKYPYKTQVQWQPVDFLLFKILLVLG